MSLLSAIKRAVPEPVKQLARSTRPEYRLARVLSRHLPNVTCIDVGASYYPHIKWRVLLESPRTHWVAVEPNEANIGYVRSWVYPSQVEAVTTGLSEHGGTQTLYITHVDSGSSLLEPVIAPSVKHRVLDLDYFFPLRKVQIDTLTLADVIARSPADSPVFVKLDTQGTELSILRGAAPYLEQRRIVGIEMEATLLAQPVMSGAGKFWEACGYLEDQGFELLHVKPIPGLSRFGKPVSRGNRYLNECDAVFALRRDIAATLPVNARTALGAFYLCNHLFEEAYALLEEDDEVRESLRASGCDTAALMTLLRHLA